MLTLDEIVAVSERLTASGHWFVDLADDALVWSGQIYRITGSGDHPGHIVGVFRDITEEKTIRENLEHEIERRNKLEAELRYLSDFDALSGMPNRRHFFEQTNRALDGAKRCGRNRVTSETPAQ